MKKNVMMRVASVLLIAVLMSTCVISGTFAKYTSANTASDSATVAKWSIEINDTEIAVTGDAPSVTFDLFKTAYDLKENGTVDTTEDDDIKADGNLIAPGSGGYYQLKIENLSEVNAQYAIAFTATNDSNVPIEFSLSNDNIDGTWKTNIADLNVAATDISMSGSEATVTLYWRWTFDRDDTNFGISTPTVSVNAAITVTQVN